MNGGKKGQSTVYFRSKWSPICYISKNPFARVNNIDAAQSISKTKQCTSSSTANGFLVRRNNQQPYFKLLESPFVDHFLLPFCLRWQFSSQYSTFFLFVFKFIFFSTFIISAPSSFARFTLEPKALCLSCIFNPLLSQSFVNSSQSFFIFCPFSHYSFFSRNSWQNTFFLVSLWTSSLTWKFFFFTFT